MTVFVGRVRVPNLRALTSFGASNVRASPDSDSRSADTMSSKR